MIEKTYMRAYIFTIGSDERGGNTSFGGVTTCIDTAKRAAHKRGGYGSTNAVESTIVVKGEDGKHYILGSYGTVGSGVTIKPRVFKFLEPGASDKEIEDYIDESRELENLNRLLGKFNDEECAALKDYFKGTDL